MIKHLDGLSGGLGDPDLAVSPALGAEHETATVHASPAPPLAGLRSTGRATCTVRSHGADVYFTVVITSEADFEPLTLGRLCPNVMSPAAPWVRSASNGSNR